MVAQKTTVNFVDSIWELLGGLLQGVPTVIIPDAVVRDSQEFVDLLVRQHVTRIWVVPALLRMLLDLYPDLHARLPHLKFWVTSGEALTLDLAQRFFAQLPTCRLINLYGTSEVFDATVADVASDLAADKRITIGRPLDNVQTYVLDHHFTPVPVGVAGELCVAGAGLAHGYLNHPDLTAEKFIPNPFERLEIRDWRLGDADNPISNLQSLISRGTRLYRTGDLARYRPDGQIEYLGRIDRQIKVRGVRIEPGEIELALAEHPAVRQAVVVARPDQTGDLRLIAYLTEEPRTENREPNSQEPRTENQEPDLEDGGWKIEDGTLGATGQPSSILHPPSSISGKLRAFLQERLPAAMIPSAFVLLDALPLTPNGKVDRRALPAPEAARVESVT